MGSSILGSGRSNLFGGSDRFPSLSSSSAARRCEEEALAWAAIERLPTYERLRTSILNDLVNNQPIGSTHNQIDVTNIPPEARKQLIDRLLGVTDQDNERFLLKLRQRLDGFSTFYTLYCFWNFVQFIVPIFIFCFCYSDWVLSYQRLASISTIDFSNFIILCLFYSECELSYRRLRSVSRI
jgi:hypothetical protein